MYVSHIYIPTFKRHDKQITYNNLPIKYKEKVIFVVQEQESNFTFFKDKNKLVVPDNIGIAKTRELLIQHHLSNYSTNFGMFDDDLTFIKRREKNSGKMIDTEFDELFELHENWLNTKEIIATSLISTTFPSNLKKNYYENSLIGSIIFYDSSKLKNLSIDYTSCKILEDIYTQIQLISYGYKTRTSLKYCVNYGKIQSDGGCSSFRTSELHNETILFLKQKYPRYIKLRKGTYKTGGFAGDKLLKAIIYLNKLYKDSISQKNSKEFFNQ